MKTRTLWTLVIAAAALVLLAGAAGALPGLDQPEVDVTDTINYQGRLTDSDGVPLSGTFPMRFQLYDAATIGTLVWDSGVLNVDVSDGLFNVPLNVDAPDFNGQALWLRIYVNGEWLIPRQELMPVPYALGLKPGAEITGESAGKFILQVNNNHPAATGSALWATAATGSAVQGRSPDGVGVYGYSENNYAVMGHDGGTSQSHGYGGYFSSMNGIGVYGWSAATPTISNAYTPGVYGSSVNGVGVFGVGASAGVRAESTDSHGLYARSQNGTAIYGYTAGGSGDYAVYGTGGESTYGVYGNNSGVTSGLGVYGHKLGGGSAVSGYNEGAGNGTWGYSATYNGAGGGTGRADGNYGLFTEDNLYSANFHSLGAIMQVVQNGGAEPLERGDLVAIAGLGDPPAEGLPPVVRVQKVDQADSTALLGVVSAGYAREWLAGGPVDPTGATAPAAAIPLSGDEPIRPGDYLLVVVQGPCRVKADAARGAIRPGDLLSSAGAGGRAGRAAEVRLDGALLAPPGTVLGKALEPLEAGQGLVYVYVTLQ